MALSESSVMVMNYLQEHNGETLTSADVAAALGIDKKKVDGAFTSFQKKGWGVRTPAEAEMPDGTHKAVKLLSLTDLGMTIDPANPPVPEKAAE